MPLQVSENLNKGDQESGENIVSKDDGYCMKNWHRDYNEISI